MITFSRRSSSKTAAALILPMLLAMTILPPLVSAFQYNAYLNRPLLLVNQVGYYPNAPKRILYQSDEAATLPENATFSVHDATTNQVVYSGLLERNVTRYGHSYMLGNFTTLNDTGHYYLKATVDGKTIQSTHFEISPDVYDKVMELSTRFYYYQRDNYKVKEIVNGYPGHAAGHMNDAMVFNGSNADDWVYKNLTGGWYDAGDYNKWISWFQTQWYCMQALVECADLDPAGKFSTMPDLVDSELPDVVDEALWGALYLKNLVNEEGIRGPEFQYRVFNDVTGFRNNEGRTAAMSYWGPPEHDWTTPRRVYFTRDNSTISIDGFNNTFVDYNRGYDIAGALMHVARIIDESKSAHPGLEFPGWVETNTTYLRSLASHVYNKYLSLQSASNDGIQSIIGKLYYLEEKSAFYGNWTDFDALVVDLINDSISPTLNDIPDKEGWPLWFGWSGYYLLGNLLTHYLTYNRTVPAALLTEVQAIQNNHFTELFDEPFRIKHGEVNIDGSIEHVLFYGAERQTDILTSAWLQSLMVRLNPNNSKPELVQSLLDWIFGVNPAGVCMMEGVGTVNFPQYHHRLSYARNPRGGGPGSLPNGMAQIRPTREIASRLGIDYDDLSFLEEFGDVGMIASWPGNPMIKDGVPSNPNEVWIPHNAMLLRLLCSIEMDNFFL
ncbi:MAG: glycoside hydrolase family 9 protein [Promethearchaeota archaeon]